MKKNKIILIVIIVICVIAGGIVSFKLYKNKEDKQEISNYSEYIKDRKDDFDKLILDDNEKKYDDLIKKSQDIINNNKVSLINKSKTDIESLYDTISRKNEEDLTKEIRNIEKKDISSFHNKGYIQKYIDKVDDYISSKEYKSAKNWIEKINILIEKDKNENAKEQTEIKKAENVKVSDDTASRDNIESLIRGYLETFPEAVNSDDFEKISYYIYPNSSLYNEQKEAISKWHKEGIREEFLGFTAKDITFSSDKLEGTITDEEVFNITNSKGTSSKTFTWKYKFKYNTDIQNYQITEICNS